MDLGDIASVTGKGGLFKIVKPTRTGVIIESIDDIKKRSIAGATTRVSILKEISIYTTGKEASIPLEDVLKKIHAKFKGKSPLEGPSNDQSLQKFLADIVPDYDTDKVYTSDIKKLISWYTTLSSKVPELFELKAAKKETIEKKPAAKKKASSPKKEIPKTVKSVDKKKTPVKKPVATKKAK